MRRNYGSDNSGLLKETSRKETMSYMAAEEQEEIISMVAEGWKTGTVSFC
jgi:hypothetical protein